MNLAAKVGLLMGVKPTLKPTSIVRLSAGELNPLVFLYLRSQPWNAFGSRVLACLFPPSPLSLILTNIVPRYSRNHTHALSIVSNRHETNKLSFNVIDRVRLHRWHAIELERRRCFSSASNFNTRWIIFNSKWVKKKERKKRRKGKISFKISTFVSFLWH